MADCDRRGSSGLSEILHNYRSSYQRLVRGDFVNLPEYFYSMSLLLLLSIVEAIGLAQIPDEVALVTLSVATAYGLETAGLLVVNGLLFSSTENILRDEFEYILKPTLFIVLTLGLLNTSTQVLTTVRMTTLLLAATFFIIGLVMATFGVHKIDGGVRNLLGMKRPFLLSLLACLVIYWVFQFLVLAQLATVMSLLQFRAGGIAIAAVLIAYYVSIYWDGYPISVSTGVGSNW